jgi:hypothetical protein
MPDFNCIGTAARRCIEPSRSPSSHRPHSTPRTTQPGKSRGAGTPCVCSRAAKTMEAATTAATTAAKTALAWVATAPAVRQADRASTHCATRRVAGHRCAYQRRWAARHTCGLRAAVSLGEATDLATANLPRGSTSRGPRPGRKDGHPDAHHNRNKKCPRDVSRVRLFISLTTATTRSVRARLGAVVASRTGGVTRRRRRSGAVARARRERGGSAHEIGPGGMRHERAQGRRRGVAEKTAGVHRVGVG